MIFGPHINKYYKKYWYLFALGFLCLIVVDIAQLFVPYLIGQMIGYLDPTLFNSFNTMAIRWNGTWFDMTLGYIVVTVLVLGVIITIGRFGWRITIFRVGLLVECDLREEMFVHLQSLPLSWFAKQKTGGIMAYFTSDLEDIKQSCSMGIVTFVDIFVLGISSLVFMFITHWVLALVCLIPISAILIISYFIMKGEVKLWDVAQQSFQDMSDLAQESITGLAVIKAFVREVREVERFSEANLKLEKKNIAYFKFQEKWGNLVVMLFIYSIEFIILAVGAYFCLSDKISFPGIPAMNRSETATLLSSFLGYFYTLLWPLRAVITFINLISRGKASLHRIETILDEPNDIRDSSYLYSEPIKGDIEFKHLTFAYPDSSLPILKDISFKVKAGERVGIVGRTGSGKSSLLLLLMKLYNIPKDMIFIDGIDINEWYGKALRDNIGLVSQDAFLFSDTINGNIGFGVKNPKVDSIRKSAKFADVDSNILELPNGYETLVGERGKSVSGGQRQRISMARAIMKDPSVLILDDSVSAVDAITEKHILSNINENRKNRTTFIISSRLSSVEHLDKILVIDKGMIVGEGTHEELLKDCAIYKKLYELQVLQKELA